MCTVRKVRSSHTRASHNFFYCCGLTVTVDISRITDMKHGSNHPNSTLIMVLKDSLSYGLVLWDIFFFMSLHHKEFLQKVSNNRVNELLGGKVST